MHPVITEQVSPGPLASHSLPMKWIAVVPSTVPPAAPSTEQCELILQHFTIRLAQGGKNHRFFGWSIPESAICTRFFSCFVPLTTIQEQAKEIPETS